MGKEIWKAGNFVYPVPAVLVSCRDKAGRENLFTAAWTGTVCTNPPMAYISVRPERYSYPMIRETGEFVINLTTEAMARAVDLCGVKSGRDVDKWKETRLTPVKSDIVKAPCIAQSPVNIECIVVQTEQLGSHDLFLAKVVAVHADEQYMDEKGGFHLENANPVVYSHGGYYDLGSKVGKFGYSVQRGGHRRSTSGKA